MARNLFLCVVALLAFAAVASAAPTAPPTPAPPSSPNKVAGIELPADMTVDPSEGFVTIKATTAGAIVKWSIFSTIQNQKVQEFGKSLVVATSPGAVIVVTANTQLVGSDNKCIITDHARMQITVKGAAPPTPPTPPAPPVNPPAPPTPVTPPTPPAPPAPVTPPGPSVGQVFTTIIFDKTKVTEEQAKALNSATMRDKLSQIGALRVIEATAAQAEIKAKNLTPWIVKAGGLPAVIVQVVGPDGKGSVKLSERIPSTDTDLINLVFQSLK